MESSDHPDDSCYNRPDFIYSSYWNHGDCWPFNARLRSGKYPDSSGLYYYGGETQRGHGWCFALSDGNLYLDARIARIGEIKNHELQGGEKAVLSDFNVEIKDVCFSYQKDTQVIRHASFTAEQGQVTALVGPSGCGKTTMLKLISRLYDADSGTVQIGGTDIREIHTDSLFKYVSIVFQEVILFNTSIMENIRLGRLDASDEEVIRAAKLAGCNEFVSRLPDTYQTIIGKMEPNSPAENVSGCPLPEQS